MKLNISVSKQNLSDRIVGELQDAGAQVSMRKLDRKTDLIAPIVWNGVADADGWDFSAFVNQDKQTVLIRAETSTPIPKDKNREVGILLKRMNSKLRYGSFSLDDRENTVGYFAGPFIYDEMDFVLRNAFVAMNCAVAGLSLSLEILSAYSDAA